MNRDSSLSDEHKRVVEEWRRAMPLSTPELHFIRTSNKTTSPHSTGGRPAQVVDVTLRPRFDPLANYAKLGDGVGAIARVAIWTGINIDWSKRTGRLPRDFSLEDSRARTRAYS